MSFRWNTASAADRVSWLGLRIQSQGNNLAQLENYYDGTQPAAFIAPELVEQLQHRVASLNVNYCRLLTQTLVERLTITGFQVNDADQLDDRIWKVWKRNNMEAETDWLLRDIFALGSGFLCVWADSKGRPTITVESPKQVASYRNPVTREIEGAVKMWSDFDDVTNVNNSFAVLYLPDKIMSFESVSPAAVNSIPSTGWQLTGSVPNPLGVVPMVEFTNRTNVLDFRGTSEYEPILGLQDALNKSLLDMMVSSEFGAFARRWVTGLVVPDDSEDPDGPPLKVFGRGPEEIWTGENPETKFGQFQAQSLGGYDTQANLLTRQIAAISGLPEYLTGTGAANPTSADAIRASELSLNAKAQQKIDLLSASFGQVGALILAILDRRRAADTIVQPVFADLENRSQAMATDAFGKLVAAGVPADIAAEKTLGWTPDDAARLLTTDRNNDDGTIPAAA